MTVLTNMKNTQMLVLGDADFREGANSVNRTAFIR